MILIASLELLVIAVLAFLLYRTIREDRMERRELLNRIQRPDLLPTLPVQTFTQPTPEPDEQHLVGVVMPLLDEDEQ